MASASLTRSRLWLSSESIPCERANRSSGSIGVTKDSVTALSTSCLAASPACSAARTADRGGVAAGPERERIKSVQRRVDLASEQPEDVGVVGYEPMVFATHIRPIQLSSCSRPKTPPARIAVIGIVISQAAPI